MSTTKPEPDESLPHADYDKWFCQKVEESLADPRPNVPHEAVMSAAHSLIAECRARLKARIEAGTAGDAESPGSASHDNFFRTEDCPPGDG